MKWVCIPAPVSQQKFDTRLEFNAGLQESRAKIVKALSALPLRGKPHAPGNDVSPQPKDR